jgi:hypothetical protein
VPWHTSRVAVVIAQTSMHARIFAEGAPDRGRGTAIAPLRRMHALDCQGELLASDRPTIPVPAPRDSGVRLKVERVAYAAATVDVVVCDLSRDPRSETFGGEDASPDTIRDGRHAQKHATHRSGFFPALARAAPRFGAFAVVVQNDRPPSTSIVRALK